MENSFLVSYRQDLAGLVSKGNPKIKDKIQKIMIFKGLDAFSSKMISILTTFLKGFDITNLHYS